MATCQHRLWQKVVGAAGEEENTWGTQGPGEGERLLTIRQYHWYDMHGNAIMANQTKIVQHLRKLKYFSPIMTQFQALPLEEKKAASTKIQHCTQKYNGFVKR